MLLPVLPLEERLPAAVGGEDAREIHLLATAARAGAAAEAVAAAGGQGEGGTSHVYLPPLNPLVDARVDVASLNHLLRRADDLEAVY